MFKVKLITIVKNFLLNTLIKANTFCNIFLYLPVTGIFLY